MPDATPSRRTGESAVGESVPEPLPRRTHTIRNAVLALAAIVALLIVSYLVPIPSVSSVRAWGDGLGPAFVWVFFAAYAVITVFPIPRTVFTVMSGIFFGPGIGLVGAMIATTIAATVAFLAARALGRSRVQRHLTKPVMRTIDYRLAVRGWLAVGSLRLIPVCPFWLLNYCAGLSAVRFVPFLVATVIATFPGTAAVVFLGDALTGRSNPALLILSGLFFAIGVIGLIVDARVPVLRQSHDQ